MNSSKINDWMQVVGIFALVASLIFVGLQMRQTQEIALSAAYQARIQTSVDMLTARAANQDALAAYYGPQTDEDLERLAPEKRWAGRLHAFILMLVYDNIHFQYEEGFISEEDWQNVLVDMTGAIQERPIVRAIMRDQRERMRPTFRTLVEQIDRE
jgi:hypothetical protein